MLLKLRNVNTDLLKIKIFFFFFYGGLCAVSIFGSTIMKQSGLTPVAIGIIYFWLPVLSVLGRIIAGVIADKFHILKLILVCSVAVCAVSALSLSIVPSGRHFTKGTFFCDSHETVVEIEDNSLETDKEMYRSCEIICNESDNFRNMCFDWYVNFFGTRNLSDFDCKYLKAELHIYEDRESQGNNYFKAKLTKVTNEFSVVVIQSPHCSKEINSTRSMDCEAENTSITVVLSSALFWILFSIYGALSLTYYIAATFADTVTYYLLGDKPHLYGSQRISGSIGWGMCSFISGFLIDLFSDSDNLEEKNFMPVFLMAFGMLSACAVWSYTLKIKQDEKISFEFSKVCSLFRQFDVCIFAYWSLLNGISQQIIWIYLFWYLEEISDTDDKEWLKRLQGCMAVMNTIFGDIISYSLVGWIVKNLDVKTCTLVVVFANFVRFFLYSILTKPVLALLIASLDGMLFGFMYSLITIYCNSVAVPGSEATVQSIFNCLFDGIGTSIGGLVGGYMYSWYGGAGLFRISSYFLLINCCILLILICSSYLVKKM